jgi:hypothetical protein
MPRDVCRTLKRMCAVMLSVWGINAASVWAATTPPNVQVVSVFSGVVVVNLDKGSVALCSEMSWAGLPPTPAGQCAQIGLVGTSPSGFTITPHEVNVYLINKTTGAIFQCATTMDVYGKPYGQCKQIGNTLAL